MTASNRREVFEFGNIGDEEQYENEYFDDEKVE